MTEFEGVVPALAQALTKRGYETLTPVQLAVLAPELKQADTLVSAQTGSGKTVAFGMAIAPEILGDTGHFTPASAPLALIVAPTRELALQVKSELQWLYAETGASFASCVGGMNMSDERRALKRGAHIVVGTPGRLRDHIERGSFDTTGLKAVVLDEADQMLDLGFRDDLEYILKSSPKDRRTLMFSATVPRSIETLAKRYQRDAVRVTTASDQTQHLDIDYRAMTVAPNDIENAIVNVLRYFDAKNALVFCGTRAAVNRMTSRFNNRGFSVVSLSGELSQNERTHALQAMRDGRARVCVATDVAARGLDLPNLELVIHAEIPKNRETLLHRSGRTGRAGRKGTCALIVPHNWRKRTERLLSSAKIDATWEKPPTAEAVMMRDHERLLTDPSLTAPLSDVETTFAQELLSRHSAEHIAAAFIRQHFSEQAAPEELIDSAPPPERPRRSHDDFGNSVWFSLSVGREQSAEPRWLLPTLCRAGHITNKDIGAIRIQANESFVEIKAEAADLFLEALGPSAKLEKTISVSRLDEPPVLSNEPAPRNNRGKRPSRDKSNSRDNRGDRDFTKSRDDRENRASRGDRDDRGSRDTAKPKKSGYPKNKPAVQVKPKPKPKAADDARGDKRDDKRDGKKPWDKPIKKSKMNKGKKTKKYQANLSKARAQDGGGDKTGATPLRRKKPKKA